MNEDHHAGLCASCRHMRRIESARGSIFFMCRRSFNEPEYPKYPRLPVLRCAGYDKNSNDSNEDLRPE